MAAVNSNFAQFQVDRSAFAQQAQKDGLNLAAVRQQAMSSLPPDASPEDRQQAMQRAMQMAVQGTGDATLQEDFTKLQQDRQQMGPLLKLKGPGGGPSGGHGGKPPGAPGQPDSSVQDLINQGDSASVGDIQSALSTMDPADPNYATLQSMLVSAQQRQPQQPSVTGGINLLG
jgi:hypothetical protein